MRLLEFYRTFGWKGSLLLVAATCGYVGIGAWLSIQLGWPDRYGSHCSGRGCFFQDLAHSPALLRGGAMLEYLLFAWLWLLPAGGVGLLLLGLWDARRRSKGLIYPSSHSKSE